MSMISSSSKGALIHLKKIKPYDGWSLEVHDSTKEIRLIRRTIPITDRYFRDVHYDPVSKNVVGIISRGTSSTSKGQVLVDPTGRPVKSGVIVFVTTYNNNSTNKQSSSSGRGDSRTRRSTTAASGGSSSGSNESLSDDQNRELMKYAVYAIGGAMVLKFLMASRTFLYFFVLPAMYLYGVQTCPTQESFDAKKELKRVLRGHHLPEDHVDKPKGWFNETVARLTATVTTELATGLGYEIEMTNFGRACWVTTVNVPAIEKAFLWLGIFGKWNYIVSYQTTNNNNGPNTSAR